MSTFKLITEREVVTTVTDEVEVGLLEYAGIKARDYRKALDLNIAQLARKANREGIDINSQWIGRFERAETSAKLEEVQTLARALGIHFQDLLPQKN